MLVQTHLQRAYFYCLTDPLTNSSLHIHCVSCCAPLQAQPLRTHEIHPPSNYETPWSSPFSWGPCSRIPSYPWTPRCQINSYRCFRCCLHHAHSHETRWCWLSLHLNHLSSRSYRVVSRHLPWSGSRHLPLYSASLFASGVGSDHWKTLG